jgi:hypothetical protein
VLYVARAHGDVSPPKESTSVKSIFSHFFMYSTCSIRFFQVFSARLFPGRFRCTRGPRCAAAAVAAATARVALATAMEPSG